MLEDRFPLDLLTICLWLSLSSSSKFWAGVTPPLPAPISNTNRTRSRRSSTGEELPLPVFTSEASSSRQRLRPLARLLTSRQQATREATGEQLTIEFAASAAPTAPPEPQDEMQMRDATQSRHKDSSSPLSLGTEAHWILSAAGRWTEEDDKEWKREQHRENMVSFRLKKKEQRSQLKTQHRVLETQLKQKLAIQRAAAARGARLAAATYSASHHRSIMTSSPIIDKTFTMHPLQQALTDLVTEKEALRGENAALEKQITEHMKLQKMIQKEGELLSSDDEMDQQMAASPVRHSLLLSSSPSFLPTANKGSFVTIEGGGPAFFYEPLSSQDCEATMRRYRQRFDYTPPRYVAGNMFGWQIERTLSQDAATGALYSRVWYTKRITCPYGNAAALLEKIERDSWHILTLPELYAKIHRQDLKSKTLQVLDEDSYVMVRSTFNTQYNMHIRYLNLVARAEAVTATGQRALNQYLLIPDSSANRLAREADPHADVKWVLDGGAFMSFIQVDDATVDVVYDHFAFCTSTQQADFLMIDWGNIVIRWEQLVHPARMLL